MENQSVTVDYRAAAIGGTSDAPAVRTSGAGSTPFDAESQIYRPVPASQIGLIDPDLGTGGSVGPRAISQLFVDLGTNVAGAGSRVTVVARIAGKLVEVQEVMDLSGVSVGYAPPFVVPQGASIRLPDVAGGGILVRMTSDAPQDVCDLQAAIASAAAIA